MSDGFYDEEAAIGNVYDRRLLARLWRYLSPYKLWVGVGVVLMLVIAGLELAPPLILLYVIDHQIAEGETDRLALMTMLYIGVLALIFVTRFIQGLIMAYVGQSVMMDLRMNVFSHLQKMSISFFDRNPVGRLVTRVTNDIDVLQQVISEGVVQMLTNLVMVSAIVVVLLVLDWQLALLMYVILVPLIYAVKRFASAQRDAFRRQRVWLAQINAYLNELITGVAVVQLFNREKRSLERFDQRNTGALKANLDVLFWYAVFEPVVVLFGAVSVAAILWYGGVRVINDGLTIGTMVAFVSYMQRFYWPVRELAERYTTLQSAMASSERVFAVLDEPEEVRDPLEPVRLPRFEGAITFDHVWFAYNPGNWVLRDVSFAIQPGEKIAVVGATGAGKSTLMALLSRFYDVQKGAILVDGIPITDFAQRELRRQVGVILQDPFVQTDTIAQNIRLRDPAISDEQVVRAARAVGADKFIERLPDGYDTMLSERGANLSTGQKQLLALARVAAFEPEIVLVMDEATASIDPATEAVIQDGLARVTAGRTTIIVAHRLNTIRAVDRILVLHHGELVEAGTHAELLAHGGYYHRLYQLQYRGQGGASGASATPVPAE